MKMIINPPREKSLGGLFFIMLGIYKLNNDISMEGYNGTSASICELIDQYVANANIKKGQTKVVNIYKSGDAASQHIMYITRYNGSTDNYHGFLLSYGTSKLRYTFRKAGTAATECISIVQTPSMYVASYQGGAYSGTTTSASVSIGSVSLPAGYYLMIQCGYASGYGATVYFGSSELNPISAGYAKLTTTTTINVKPTSSSSTTFTNYYIKFLKVY